MELILKELVFRVDVEVYQNGGLETGEQEKQLRQWVGSTGLQEHSIPKDCYTGDQKEAQVEGSWVVAYMRQQENGNFRF